MKTRFMLFRTHLSWLAVLVCVLASACSTQPGNQRSMYRGFNSPDSLHAYLLAKGGRPGLISAHRGGPEPGYPENALDTFEHALTFAPCIIECDVRETRDGNLVLMHDSTLDRTSTGQGEVERSDLADLRGLFLRDPAGGITSSRIPTLGETLEWARGRCILTLDVKAARILPGVLSAIDRYDARGYAVVITYSHEQALLAHRMDPRVVISASASSLSSLDRLLNLGIPETRLVVFVGTREPEPQVYARLADKGIPAILGTMNRLDRLARLRGGRVYRSLIRNGADILSTDHVWRVARSLENHHSSGTGPSSGEKKR